MDTLVERVRDFLWAPPGSGGFVERVFRRLSQFIYAIGRDLAGGQLTLRATGLVYTTLLSLVPLLAFSFSVLKGFGVHRQIEPLLYNFLEPLGERGEEITRQVISFVDNINGSVLGGVGLVFLLYTAISMVQKVEESCNYVWQVEQARSIGRRFSDYLSVILIGPVVMVTAMGIIASISSYSLVQRVAAIEPFGTGLVLAGKLTPYVLVMLVFTFVYAFVPNTRVRLRAALVGAVIAGLLWGTTGQLFARFVVGSTRYAAIYSSFAIAILALLWLYVNWLILLIGAQVAFYAQYPRYLRTGNSTVELGNVQRERLALEIMYLAGHAHRSGQPLAVEDVVQRIGLPARSIEPVAGALARAGLVVRTERGQVVPGRDTDAILLADVLAAVRAPLTEGLLRTDPPVDALLDEIRTAITRDLEGRTVRDLIEGPGPGSLPGEPAEHRDAGDLRAILGAGNRHG
jgi:membrane protein